MKRNYFIFLIIILTAQMFSGQSLTFISENNGKPLPKVSVFGKDGSILAYSDIEGKIDKKVLHPDQEKFQLVYDNYPIATLSYADLDKEVIKLNDVVKEIAPIVLRNGKPAKYIIVKGNFNAYVTVNNTLNCYADGIAAYVFDNETKKLKNTYVEQYRMFRLENQKNDRKQTSSWDYDAALEIPDIKEVGNILDYKTKKNTVIKELKGPRKDQIEITGEALQKKEFAFLGYRFFDVRSILNVSYEKDSKKTLKDFVEFNEISFLKLKHKSEPDYNQLILYTNFYPSELSFTDQADKIKIKFNTHNSNYTTNYWEEASFPNMQKVFSSFFKDDLKEQQNKK